MSKKAEQKVAEAILQKTDPIEIGNKTYSVAPPSTATLIEVSGLISQFPKIDPQTNNILNESLRTAKDCKSLGDIIATLILGAEPPYRRIVGRWKKKAYSRNKKQLKNDLLHHKTPAELSMLTARILKMMQIDFFFSTIIFLSEVNMTKPTKETETTAFGES